MNTKILRAKHLLRMTLRANHAPDSEGATSSENVHKDSEGELPLENDSNHPSGT